MTRGSSPSAAAPPVVALAITPPVGSDRTPIRVELEGLPERFVAGWIGRYHGIVRVARAADGPTSARVRATPAPAADRLRTPTGILRVPTVRWRGGPSPAAVCHRHRLTLADPGPDLLELRDADPGAETAVAIEALLDLWMARLLARRGVAVVHAAAFEVGALQVIAAGPSGSGKSTLAAAALVAGGRVVSDDLLLVGLDAGGAVAVTPSRRDLGFRDETRPVLTADLRNQLRRESDGQDERWVLHRSASSRLFVEAITPRTVWAVSVDRRLNRSRPVPTSQARTLAALIASTSALFLGRGFAAERSALLPVLSSLAAATEGFRIRLGRDLLHEPAVALDRLAAIRAR